MSLTLACFTGGVASFALFVQGVKEVIRWACMQTLSGLFQQIVSFSTTETETAASLAFVTCVVTRLTCSVRGIYKETAEEMHKWFIE